MRTKVQFLPEQLSHSFSFESYKNLVAELVSQGKTSGNDQREDLIHYTELNARRMKRIEKTTILNEELQKSISSIKEPLTWILISEAWCGDAAQIVPVLAKIAEAQELIDLKIILRDEHESIMDLYLTNGGRSIPKLICLDAHFQEVFVWGPRPKSIQQVVVETKAEGITDHAVLVERVQTAYNHDRTQSIQAEIKELIDLI
ncbi:MAG: thioredoxin family protein [Flavobacteriales bacterium]